MTEAELYELVAIYVSNCISSFTVYVTLTFGYLTVAYLVAARLTAFQATIATAIYTLASTSCIFTLLNSLSFLTVLDAKLSEISELFPQVLLNNPHAWFYFMAVVTTSGLLASIVFFYNARTASAKTG